jgi:RNA-directed DNA polymerase
VIASLNPLLRGWAVYHREGNNVGMMNRLDRWVRKRLRGYIYKRWWIFCGYKRNKPTEEDFAEMGIISMRKVLRPDTLQLSLFPAPL